ncbi:predicted protein [Naegleria gruberi]|uniref:O-acyltransferase n=1 Tax=Naegleria gruberi TaxID=5762 RepID=D2VEI6_NAEGR|nr:uncharacterized protein NAEGRDRAFT_57973 [Naegleria gruberi]EFC44804.1 predicted protein [Naegleria gruberi]|eukprot:XP_002677548.1 predicted protein [Naegleria gruberi strain NEG-M]
MRRNKTSQDKQDVVEEVNEVEKVDSQQKEEIMQAPPPESKEQIEKNLVVDHARKPKTVEDFFLERPSLLTFEESDSEDELDLKKKKKVSFDGFMNLTIIFLVAAVIRTMIDNLSERGLLFPNLGLLHCISDELIQRSCVDVLIFTLTYNSVIYLNSSLRMYLLPLIGKDGSIVDKLITIIETLVFYGSTFSYIGIFVVAIFIKRLSLMVNIVIVFTMMIYGMKAYSYYDYIRRRKFTLKKEGKSVNSDDERNIEKPTSPISLFREYCYFLFAPTLCFFRSYPMTNTIRISFILKQVFSILICGLVGWFIFIQYLEPLFRNSASVDLTPPSIEHLITLFEENKNSSTQNIIDAFRGSKSDQHFLNNLGKFGYLLLKTSVPWFVLWLILSFAFFHCYLNILAELCCWGDRYFFNDWWNAPDFQTFWKNWNRPVHQWLLRHVYQPSLGSNISKPISVFFTFLTSAILHEICMAMVFRSLKLYFFYAMIVQAPFVLLAQYFGQYKPRKEKKDKQKESGMKKVPSLLQLPAKAEEKFKELERRILEFKSDVEKKLKSRKSKNFLNRLGNTSMWISLFLGQPLLCFAYFQVFYSSESMICDVRNNKYGYGLVFDRWSDSFSNGTISNIGNRLIDGEWKIILDQLFSIVTAALL